jgi:hypothetical protein
MRATLPIESNHWLSAIASENQGYTPALLATKKKEPRQKAENEEDCLTFYVFEYA